jgi:hypothetical protein
LPSERAQAAQHELAAIPVDDDYGDARQAFYRMQFTSPER